jgi:hypothetical protein
MTDTTVGSCPKCDAEIALTASECPDCKTNLGPGSMWKVRPGRMPSRVNCWREGKVLGLRRGSELPHRCLKCNEPAQVPVAARSMTWHHPGWYLLVPVGILIYIIVALIVRRRASVPVPLCAKHKRRRLISLSIALVGSIVGIVAVFGGGAVTALGLLLLLTGIGFGVVGTRDIYPGRITSGEAYLRGCGPAFLNTIPEGRPSGVEAVSVGGAAAVVSLAVVGVFVIGILAAIAIPAYHDYAARAQAKARPWIVHPYPQDGFQAEFSGNVIVTPQNLDAQTLQGITRVTQYMQDDGSSAYLVVALLTKNGPTLKNAAAGIAKMECKTVLQDSAVPFPAGQGRLIQATDCKNNLRVEARYFTTGLWFYQVLAAVPKDRGDLVSARYFVESFKLAK